MRPPVWILLLLAAATVALLIVSGWQPYDRGTWWMEVAPVLVALPLLIATHRRWPLTPLAYGCIFVHACILMLGGAYVRARVPWAFTCRTSWVSIATPTTASGTSRRVSCRRCWCAKC